MLYALIVCVEKKPEEFPFYVRMLVFILINPFLIFFSKQFHSIGRRTIYFRLCGQRTGKRPEQEVGTKDKHILL